MDTEKNVKIDTIVFGAVVPAVISLDRGVVFSYFYLRNHFGLGHKAVLTLPEATKLSVVLRQCLSSGRGIASRQSARERHASQETGDS